MIAKKRGSRLRVSWNELVDWSREKEWGGLYDYKKLGWFRARFKDEALHGSLEGHGFSSGLQIMMADLFVDQDLEIASDQTEPTVGFGLTAHGSCVKAYRDDKGRSVEAPLHPGLVFAGSYCGTSATTIFAGSGRHKVVTIRLTRSAVPGLLGERDARLPELLGRLLQPSDSGKVSREEIPSPALEHVLHQMLHCPFTGSARRLFMEAKALEIFARRLGEFSDNTLENDSILAAGDLERIREARNILDSEFADPPSLPGLAHRIGMNDCKFKRSFRDVFGTTVFSYVRRLRMDKARELLESGDFSVTEVALAVGYSSFGHFAAAFKRSFGVLPSRYRRMGKRYSSSQK